METFLLVQDIPYLIAAQKLKSVIFLLTAFSKNERINILLADDDVEDCEFFEEALGELDYKANVSVVHNGEELISFINKKDSTQPDIIFLDINMPCMNGIECLSELRKKKNMRNIPVVMFTTSSTRKDIETTYANGAKLFLTKPKSIKELSKKVYKIFGLDWDLYPANNGIEKFVVK